MTTTLRRLFSGLALGAALASGSLALSAVGAGTALAATLSADTVRITLKDGRVIEGVLVEETDAYVKVQVKRAIGLATETYQKTEIAKVEKIDGTQPGTPAPATPPSGDAPKPATPPSGDKPAGDEKGKENTDPNAVKVYVIPFKGEFGHDITVTPLKTILGEAKKMKAEVIVVRIDCDFTYHGQDRQEYANADAGAAFNQLETVRELSTLFTDAIRDDPEWKVNTASGKPRLVAWVKKALGGVAFMPYICPEIYYTTDGRHGGIGYLEHIFDGRGDEVVRQKQYSLRLARAEGLAIKGGHDEKLIRAMARTDYVLSVSFVGGKPVYHEDYTGDELLTDDGKEDRMDTMEALIRFQGNDVLTLDSKMANRLGLSLGTCDTMEDLAFELGISRNYTILPAKSGKILSNWAHDVDAAEAEFRRLFREFNNVQVQGNTPEERNRGRGQQLRILEEVKRLLERYGEAINPEAIRGAPEQWSVRINQLIEQIRQQMRLDKPQKR